MNAQVKTIANQKGGVAKTTTTENLGIGLANNGKKVLLIDADAQGSLTASLGYDHPDEMKDTLSTVMAKIIEDKPFPPTDAILHHAEGIDLLPGNIELSGMEASLVNVMSRESILHHYVEAVRPYYDYILIDSQPSLGMMTINALAAADSVLIPVQAEYLPVKGLQQLLHTIAKVKRQINPKLRIDGILLTIIDERTNFSKDITALLRETYGGKLRIFPQGIPSPSGPKKPSAEGKSIYRHDPHGKVAGAYRALTAEVLKMDRQETRHMDMAR